MDKGKSGFKGVCEDTIIIKKILSGEIALFERINTVLFTIGKSFAPEGRI